MCNLLFLLSLFLPQNVLVIDKIKGKNKIKLLVKYSYIQDYDPVN